jgi:hypothetical protein
MADTAVAPRPRRKWGWIFVVLFVIQALLFGAKIGTDLADAQRERRAVPSLTPENGSMAQLKARQLDNEVVLLSGLAGICSLLTLTGAFIGLRRPKTSHQS